MAKFVGGANKLDCWCIYQNKDFPPTVCSDLASAGTPKLYTPFD
jgi:hypothetical protein